MRKRTLRRLTPQARELAKLYNELQSINRRLKTVKPIWALPKENGHDYQKINYAG